MTDFVLQPWHLLVESWREPCTRSSNGPSADYTDASVIGDGCITAGNLLNASPGRLFRLGGWLGKHEECRERSRTRLLTEHA